MPETVSHPPPIYPLTPPTYPKDSIYFAWNDCIGRHPQHEDIFLFIQLGRQTVYTDALRAVEDLYKLKEQSKAASLAKGPRRHWEAELHLGKRILCENKSRPLDPINN